MNQTDAAKVKDALQRLDPKDDGHWTSKGQPRVDVLASLSGVTALTRIELEKIAPDFNRETAGKEISISAQPSPSLETASGVRSDLTPGISDDGAKAPTASEARATHKKELEDELAKVRQNMGLLRRQEHELIGDLDEVVKQETKAEGPHANQVAIMDWIETQKAQRARRAERQRELLAAGVEPHELADYKAPIDAAMQRGGGFGRSRPQWPRVS